MFSDSLLKGVADDLVAGDQNKSADEILAMVSLVSEIISRLNARNGWGLVEN